MSPTMAPCEWPVTYAGCATDENGKPTCFADAEQQALFEGIATEYLWQWTHRRYGVCETVLRPCRLDCTAGDSTWNRAVLAATPTSWQPVIIGGEWFNVGCGGCGNPCSCSAVSSLDLPGPVSEIVSVVIDGQPRDAASYRVDDSRLLVSMDEPWPVCQDMSKPPGEPGTWTVTYRRGVEVPSGGQVAAGVLACELAKAACRDSSCQLPQRVQTITRQGVTVAMLDAFDDVDKGHTGIWIIDSWLASVTKPLLPSTVRSPDVPSPRNRVTTWPTP